MSRSNFRPGGRSPRPGFSLLASTGLLEAMLLLAPAGAFAAAPPSLVAAPVDRVVLDARGARVTRAATLPAGRQRFVLEGLTAHLDEQSVTVQTDPPTPIRGLRLERVPGEVSGHPDHDRLQAEVRDLQDQIADIDDRMAAAQTIIDFLAGITPTDVARSDQPDPWSPALDALAGMDTLKRTRRDLEQDRRPLARALRVAEERLALLGSQQRASYQLSLEASPTVASRLTVSYRVNQAGWAPRYRLRLDTQAGILETVLLAEIRQGTGQDWSNVALSVRTDAVSHQTQAPRITSRTVSPAADRGSAAFREATAGLEMSQADSMAAPAARATAELTGLSLNYELDEAATIPGDNAPTTVVLDRWSRPAAVRHVASPRQNPAAFVEAWVSPRQDQAIPPGPARLYRDGGYVGSHRLPHALEADGREHIGFGPDPQVRVRFRQTPITDADAGVFSSDRVQGQRLSYEVTNGHGKPIMLRLIDALPYATHDEIEIETVFDGPVPDPVDAENAPGIVAWDADLAAGESFAPAVDVAIRSPEDMTLSPW